MFDLFYVYLYEVIQSYIKMLFKLFCFEIFFDIVFFFKYIGIILYFMLNIISFRELNNFFIDWNWILKLLIFYLYFYWIFVFCIILILFCRLFMSLWNWYCLIFCSILIEEGDIQMLEEIKSGNDKRNLIILKIYCCILEWIRLYYYMYLDFMS